MVPTASPTPTATATPEPTTTATPTEGEATSTETATASPTPSSTPTPTQTTTDGAVQEVVVGPNGSLSFAPESFRIAAGDTVQWTWDAGGHNVKPSSTPGGADWSGTPGGEFETYDSSYTYSHTFDVAGAYEYYCAPHQSAGMTGSFTVE
jgi:plastocyanin